VRDEPDAKDGASLGDPLTNPLQAEMSVPATSKTFLATHPSPIEQQLPILWHQQPHLQRDINQGGNGNPILQRKAIDRCARYGGNRLR
jgi:hypothetical protein